MNQSGVIERAITKLEALQSLSTPGPWVARFDGFEPFEIDEEVEGIDLPDEIRVGGGNWAVSPGAYNTTDVVVDADTGNMDVSDLQTVAANAELVCAFSRSLEPILSILRHALLSADLLDLKQAEVLAGAILNEEEGTTDE